MELLSFHIIPQSQQGAGPQTDQNISLYRIEEKKNGRFGTANRFGGVTWVFHIKLIIIFVSIGTGLFYNSFKGILSITGTG